MATNSTNINKTIIHFSPQTNENKEDADIWRWKSIIFVNGQMDGNIVSVLLFRPVEFPVRVRVRIRFLGLGLGLGWAWKK